MFLNFFTIFLPTLSPTYSSYVPETLNKAVETFLTRRINVDHALRDWMVEKGHNQTDFSFPQQLDKINVKDLFGRFNLTSNLTSAVFHIYHPDHLVNYTGVTSFGSLEVLRIVFKQPAVTPYITGLHSTKGIILTDLVLSDGGWRLTYPSFQTTVYVPFYINEYGYLTCNGRLKDAFIRYDETFDFEDDAIISSGHPLYSSIIYGYKDEVGMTYYFGMFSNPQFEEVRRFVCATLLEKTVKEILAETSMASTIELYTFKILVMVVLLGKLKH